MSDRLCARLDDLITCLDTLQTKGEGSDERVPAGLHDLYYHTRNLAADIDTDLEYERAHSVSTSSCRVRRSRWHLTRREISAHK